MKIRATFVKVALFVTLVLCFFVLCSCGNDGSATALQFTSNGDGTCYVSGIGDCTLEEIIIPQVSPKGDRVTAIGDNAFFECFTLKKITIPESVTYIGNNAFRGCIYLAEIVIPKSVQFIGESALMGCKALEKIEVDVDNDIYSDLGNCLIHMQSKALLAGCGKSTVPYNGSVTTIADYAFFDQDDLASIDIGDHITSIGDHAFESCDNLKTVVAGAGLESIGDYGFAACDNLKTFSLDGSSSLKSIGEFAFNACDDLASFYFPSSLSSVGQGAFWSCNSFSKAYTDDISAWAQIEFASTSATPLNYGKLYYNNSLVVDLVIPEGTKKIGNNAFYNATDIISVQLPDSVTSIGDYAFANCADMTDITFGSSLQSIGEQAFGNCAALLSISLPKSVESIGDHAFFSCGALKNISVADGNQKYSGSGDCLVDKETKKLIAGCGSSVIPQDGSVTSIGDYAFYNCMGLTTVTIPESVKAIGCQAFDGCAALSDVSFASSGWVAYKMESDTDGVSITASTANIKVSYVTYYWRKK